MTIQEEIQESFVNNRYYIRVNDENKVIAHNGFLRTEEDDWIKIYFDYSYQPCTIGDFRSEYLPEFNTIREVPVDYFLSERLAADKIRKEDDISNLVVTISTGKEFDGDEVSQERMVRAIQTADITGLTETQWKLADNTIVTVTLDELKEALALSAQEMSRIWLEQSEE